MDNNRPFFSVIVPVYNVESYLKECLDSVLSQTFQNFEIIVVDDRSTDSSGAIARQYALDYPEKVRVIEHPVNKGLGGARNTGIEAAQGEYLQFLDSDDYLKPNTLEDIYKIISEHEKIDVVGFDFEWVNEDGSFLMHESCSRRNLRPEDRNCFVLRHTVSACNKVFFRDVFIENEIRFPEKRYYEDYWTIPKIMMVARDGVFCDEAFYCYRQRGTSIMHDVNVAKAEDIMAGTDELLRFCREKQGLHDRIKEIEMLAIEHVLIYATLRVNCIDPKTDMQFRLRDYMADRFPNYKQNPYVFLLSAKYQRLKRLIENGSYGMLHLCYYRRNKVTSSIKQILRKALGENFVRCISKG